MLSSLGSLSPQGVPAASQSTSGTYVVLFTSKAELKTVERPWQDLADNAATPNVFLEPWQFLPAFEAYGRAKTSIIIFVVRQSAGPRPVRELIGFIPMELDSPEARLPGTVLSSWRHTNLPLGTPLLRRGFEAQAWAAFFDWLRASPHRNRIVEFSRLLGEGGSYWALIDYLHEHSTIVTLVEQFTRAQLERPANDVDGPLDHQASGIRKELRRQRRRLSEQGVLEFRTLRADEPPEPWIEQFLQLEAAGWKREAGSAFSCHEHTERYFRAICLDGHVRGKLQMLGLFLDGRPIALKCNFVTGDTGFSLKIAYDEHFKAFSPGVLLELETMEAFYLESHPTRFDSCAIPRHTMINRLWRFRRPIVALAVSSGAVWPNLKLGAYSALRSIKRSVRSTEER